MFKEWLARKLIERFVRSDVIEEIVLANVIKLKLLESIRIHPVVNVSRCHIPVQDYSILSNSHHGWPLILLLTYFQSI